MTDLTVRSKTVGGKGKRRPQTPHPLGATASLALIAFAFATACAGTTGGPPIPTDPAARAAEITRLEASIARDRHALEDLVTRSKDETQGALHDDAELREIANRLASDVRWLDQIKQSQIPPREPTASP